MTVEFIAEGRIVWGHPGKPQKAKNLKTGQPKLNKQGQEYDQWSFGIAVEKNSFMASVWPYMQQEASASLPSGIPQDFSWKIKDGDIAVDKKGKPFREYEGRAGCMILTISTTAFAPPLYKMNPQTNQYDQITADEIKCGDYVAVSINCKFNGENGIYINPQGIVHIGYGPEIVSSSFDVGTAFAGFTAQLPQGASATPVISNTPLPGTMQGQMPAQAPVATPAPQPVGNVQPAPVANSYPAASNVAVNVPLPVPAHDFVANAGQPQYQPNAPVTPPIYPQAVAPSQPVQQGSVLPNGMVGIPQGR